MTRNSAKIMYATIAVILMLTGITLGSPNASAASDWDDKLLFTEDLTIGGWYSAEYRTDITNSYIGIIEECNPGAYASLMSVVSSSDRGWGVSQNGYLSGHFSDTRGVVVYWTDSPETVSFNFAEVGGEYSLNLTSTANNINRIFIGKEDFGTGDTVCHYQENIKGMPAISYFYDGNPEQSFSWIFYSNFVIEYPEGYAGPNIPSDDEDYDEDGLSLRQELLQGTLDTEIDTDGDGLNDYVESVHYPSRNQIFCGIECAYPNPTKKDVYLEIDWMKDQADVEYRPNSTQLNPVIDLYADEDINLHIDTGQYGGGNQLSTHTQSLPYSKLDSGVDFEDYKYGGNGISSNFQGNREDVWRYMIAGYEYAETPGSSGWAKVMQSDMFLSSGLLLDVYSDDVEDALISRTIAHELGHSMCLSPVKYYVEQPDECVYAGIDNYDETSPYYNLNNYKSIMNYGYQLHPDTIPLAYSDGTNGTGDHDDLNAIKKGMSKFSQSNTLLEVSTSHGDKVSNNHGIAEEPPIREITDPKYLEEGSGESSNETSGGVGNNHGAAEEPPMEENMNPKDLEKRSDESNETSEGVDGDGSTTNRQFTNQPLVIAGIAATIALGIGVAAFVLHQRKK